MKSIRVSLRVAVLLCSTLASSLHAQEPAAAPSKGTVEPIKVHGKSLDGNLEGDPADRDVVVYLPPGYAAGTTMDVGTQDGLAATNRQLNENLQKLGLVHTFETYEGDHNNRVPNRIEEKVLPFFSDNLSFTAPPRR